MFVTSNKSLASFFVNASKEQLDVLYMVFIISYCIHLNFQFTAVGPLTWLLPKIPMLWNCKNVSLLHLIFKTCHVPSAYISQLYLLKIEQEIYSSLENQNTVECCKLVKKCHPVTGTLLKTAQWIFKIYCLLGFQIVIAGGELLFSYIRN